jgi:hypothetical protein
MRIRDLLKIKLNPKTWNFFVWEGVFIFIAKSTLPRSGFSRPHDYAYQPLLQIAQIPDVSLKEGAVIGAVLGTRKFHRGQQGSSQGILAYRASMHAPPRGRRRARMKLKKK